ncbi:MULTISPECIES: GMC family oxidoreductase [unclassified Paenibacillus]|uniref:GMC family oxidoreductase n=1 Tax=unclassified Paenibacillus TaxID=185978 RepID=UPI00104F93C0|nr:MULTISPECIES: GMC family oxidoreductase [unclassified Paenibacillus]NIK71657.1 gluconate 2-dehydrogenase alpha chain [Paenibacillus sp. BK720]TCM96306.1 gluconate 2-dehydrogenase alpha chain [Paenibacillus sp. BK033]
MATTLPKVPVVIVGMGWVGGIIAAELTKAGISVVGLERGKSRDTQDYYHVHDELRYAARYELMQDLSKETVTFRNTMKMRALPMRTYGSFLLGDGLGGAGVHWNGQYYRFLPYDFEIYSKTVERYGKKKIPENMTLRDWGITYDQLEPYFVKYEQMAGISGEKELPSNIGKMSTPFATGPMKKTPGMKLFEDAAKKLGYNPYVIPSANLSEPYKNPDGVERAPCQYCGYCERFGCEYGAKADPVVTVLPVAKQTGKLEVRTHSNVIKINHEGKKATGVTYVHTPTGEEYIQPADVVILASYVFSNVRLLLLSKLGEPYDPQSQKGSVGRNYAYQVNGASTSIFYEDREFNLAMGAGALGSSIDDFNGDNFDHSDLKFLHGANIRFTQTGLRPIQYQPVPAGTPKWGAEFKKATIHNSNRVLSVTGQGASMPNRYHFLDLDPEYKDALGLPLIRMTFDFEDQDRELVKFIAQKTKEIADQMGGTKTEIHDSLKQYNIVPYQSTHNTGGTIMGTDPKTSVVNNYLQMWDAENVFICGASNFSHNSGYNPTSTVGALAYRTAEGVQKYIDKGGSLV